MEKPWHIAYAATSHVDADTDGDGVRDGADDQDHDDVPNVMELSRNAASGLTTGTRKTCASARARRRSRRTTGTRERVRPREPVQPVPAEPLLAHLPARSSNASLGAPFDGSPNWYSLQLRGDPHPLFPRPAHRAGLGRSGLRGRDLHFPALMISTNQFKNGNHIEVEGTVFKILEFQHVKPGKGGAFVRTKLRRASDGAVIDRTFRAGEKFRPVRTEARKMQFLYADGTDAHFMDEESFEQLAIPEASLADPLKWIKPSETVDLLFIDDQPSDVQLSASVELEVTHTEPGVRGDTASGGGNKPATLETGATIQVPLFVNIGDRVKVDTRSGAYMSRA